MSLRELRAVPVLALLLALPALVGIPVSGTAPAAASPPSEADVAEALRDHVAFLASEELEGRMTGAEATRTATEYLAAELSEMGLAPLPGTDGYRHPFEFTAGVRDAGSAIAVEADDRRQSWATTEHVRALSFSDVGTVSGPLVFAGYGLTLPDSSELPYDSFAGLDVDGKIVLALRYVPEDVDAETRSELARYSGLRYKAMRARELGAEALLIVTGPRSPNAGETIPMTFDTALSGSGIVAASIGEAVGRSIFSAAPDRSLEEIQAELDTGNPHVQGFEIPGLVVDLEVDVAREVRTGTNVIGVLGAGEEVGERVVMVGAHYDHLGRGGHGNSLARGDEAGKVHPGADDNASGVATVLETARSLAADPPPVPVVVAFWSGEELGLLGSSAFVDDPPFPLDRLVAYLNFDMVGRLRDNRLTVQGTGSSPDWPGLLEGVNVLAGFDLSLQEDPYLPTDSTAFYQEGVPSLSYFTGSHEDYHRPGDLADRLNYEGMARLVDLGGRLTRRVASLSGGPDYAVVERRAGPAGDRDTVRAFTGTIPDYTSDVEGLRLGGVIEGGPAQEADLREGDVIVRLGEHEITNIYDYTYALDAVELGEPVRIVYLRDGERHETTIVPRARD